MTNKPSIPSSAEILARLDAALEASGLHERKAVRDPLPLFRQLFDEWLINQDIPVEATDELTINTLLKKHTATQLQSVLRSIFEEAVQLSSAHSTLSVWTRRELDQELRRLQTIIEREQSQRDSNTSY